MWKPQPWLTLLLLVPLGSTSKEPPPLPKEQVVCWLATRKLKWEDFQATSESKLPEYNVQPNTFIAASTEAKAIVYDQTNFLGQYLGSVLSVQFDKRKSWVNKEYSFDRKATMVHEQIHFDIVELTGRKIRQVLARYATKPGSYHSPEHDAEIGCLYDEEDGLQLLFDQESRAGNDLKAQARWQGFVRQELAKLREFESTAKDCLVP